MFQHGSRDILIPFRHRDCLINKGLFAVVILNLHLFCISMSEAFDRSSSFAAKVNP